MFEDPMQVVQEDGEDDNNTGKETDDNFNEIFVNSKNYIEETMDYYLVDIVQDNTLDATEDYSNTNEQSMATNTGYIP